MSDSLPLHGECFCGQLKCTIALAEPVVGEKMQTDHKDGVLTITVQKNRLPCPRVSANKIY